MDIWLSSFFSGISTALIWLIIAIALWWVLDIAKIRQL